MKFVPSIALTTWGVLPWLFVLDILIATDIFVLPFYQKFRQAFDKRKKPSLQ